MTYTSFDDLDFNTITMGFRRLPFFEDDVYLGMQVMNVGITDAVITKLEHNLLRKFIELERTPTDQALTVSAFSQMWIYNLYEVLRMWRDRRYQFITLHDNGGIIMKLENMPSDDPVNVTIEIRKAQLVRFMDDTVYRDNIETAWSNIETVYRMTELFRMNLAKHCAPGRDRAIPRAPGYGRINFECGALDYELIESTGAYSILNRRNIADALRIAIN